MLIIRRSNCINSVHHLVRLVCVTAWYASQEGTALIQLMCLKSSVVAGKVFRTGVQRTCNSCGCRTHKKLQRDSALIRQRTLCSANTLTYGHFKYRPPAGELLVIDFTSTLFLLSHIIHECECTNTATVL